jgi:uncharacterized protein (DUF2164 family)
MAIRLQPETRERAIDSIRQYFDDELDQEIGDLKAGLLLDYFLAEIGPSVYNRAVADAASYMQERVADLDASCFEPEFGYDASKR